MWRLEKNAENISVRKPEGRSEDVVIGDRIILKLSLGKYICTVYVGLIWLRIWTAGGLLWARL
jgi:hypothetical protein